MQKTVFIRKIFISEAHNFRGHHGQPPGTHEARSVDRVECVAGRGLRGDRYFDLKPDFKGQITFFDRRTFKALCEHLGMEGEEKNLRRNVVVEGLDLHRLIGQRFSLQGVEFEGSEECRPCYWMDEAFQAGAEEFLKGCGGLRARILADGFLKVGVAEFLNLQAK